MKHARKFRQKNNVGLVQDKFVPAVFLIVLEIVVINYAKNVQRSIINRLHLDIRYARCIVDSKIYITKAYIA